MATKFKEGNIVTIREKHKYLGLRKNEAGLVTGVREDLYGLAELDVNFYNNDRDSIIVTPDEVRLVENATEEVPLSDLQEGDSIVGIKVKSGKLITSTVKAIQWVDELEAVIVITDKFYLLAEDGEMFTKVVKE